MIDNYCFDTHIHVETELMTPYTALELIREKGLRAALVDHVFSDRNRITADSVKKDCCAKFPDVEYLHGCEVDAYGDGQFALSDSLAASMDFVMVSFTHIDQPGVVDDNHLDNMEKLSDRLLYLFDAAVHWPYTDVIGHPFSLPFDSVRSEELVKLINTGRLKSILSQAAKRNVMIEINSRTLRRMALEPQKFLLKEAFACGCLFTVGSDAHCLDEVGKTDMAWNIIDELQIPPELIQFPPFK